MERVYGAGLIIITSDNKILLGKRADNHLWSIPGGKFDPELDKDFRDTAIRETKEETGYRVDRSDIIYAFNNFCPYYKYDKNTKEILKTKLAFSKVYILKNADSYFYIEDETNIFYDGEMEKLRWFSFKEIIERADIFTPTLVTLNKIFEEEIWDEFPADR